MMSLWDALRMNMMISYQELVRTFLKEIINNEIDAFLLEQKKKNKRFPYSEDRDVIRPLWGKCLTGQ